MTLNFKPQQKKEVKANPKILACVTHEWATATTLIIVFSITERLFKIGYFNWFQPFWSIWQQYQISLILGLLITLMIFIAVFFIQHLLHHKTLRNTTNNIAATTQKHLLKPHNLWGLIIFNVLMPPMAWTYSNIKQAIPNHNYFSWDIILYKLDKLLLGGHSPWKILLPILDHPLIMQTLETSYLLWFIVVAVFSTYMIFLPNRQLRQQYFINYFLCWIIGGCLMATIFSSAGPCYIDKITGISAIPTDLQVYLTKFRSLSNYLSYPMTQDFLWGIQQHSNKHVTLAGISAFPSLHVTMSLLIANTTAKINQTFGKIAYCYALIIIVSSVALGWHYLADTLGAILVLLITTPIAKTMVTKMSINTDNSTPNKS